MDCISFAVDLWNAQTPAKQTFYFKDELVYTEDHVLVKNLFFFNISNLVTSRQLRKYFAKFGNVARLQILEAKGTASKPRSGYVCFHNPRHAAKALQRKVHYVNGCRLSVRPSDSWHQPDAQDLTRYPANMQPPKGNHSKAETIPIMRLNDDCLEHIVRMLALADRIHFARSCIRFRNVYQNVSPTLEKFVNFHTFESMTVWDVRDFFKLSGRHVQHIEGIMPERHCKHVCEFLGKYCINLQSMRVMANKLTSTSMSKMFAKLKSLESVELRGCALSNDGLLAMGHLKKLKKIDLAHNDRLTGENMDRFPRCVETLILTNCSGILAEKLAVACKALTQLKELHLKSVPRCFRELVVEKCCESLEVLATNCGSREYAEYQYVGQLPSLKKLILHSYPTDTLPTRLITGLAEHKSMQLEYFESRGSNCINAPMLLDIGKLGALRTLYLPNNNEITDQSLESLYSLQNLEEINLKYSINITDNGILRLILACAKLHVLHLNDCVQITDQLLKDIILKLKLAQNTPRTLPIKLTVTGTSVNYQTLHHPEVAAKKIIDVTLTLPSAGTCSFNMHDLFNIDPDDYNFDSDNSFDTEFEDEDDFLSDDSDPHFDFF
ncbi:uncharacterized protein LOC117567705 [Drosophila albomicans]|uniref:Uncharacterized protein LOC117567705 n=1 Tax=Drosophila albomicans TaxID=7291 RepID=A0A6P8WJ36_DROAB|nr:uncharacterized protein LOC117567705 [Drosophila albomicans]